MAEESFEDNLRYSFKRVKEHNQLIESELLALKELVYKQNSQIEFLLKSLKAILNEMDSFKAKTLSKEVSSGNEGVYSFIHSFDKHSFTSQSGTTPIQSASSLKKDILSAFANIPKQELFTFLTVLQLEEDTGLPVLYSQLSQKMSLSEGCIRTYVSSLLRKNLPLRKIKQNNRTIYLSVSKDFHDLSLKNDLISLFYRVDPEQTLLFRS